MNLTISYGVRCSGARSHYLFKHTALAKVFRAKLLQAITGAGLPLPCDVPEKWVVDCRHVGTGEKALVYLGRYLYTCCPGAFAGPAISAFCTPTASG